VISGIFTVLAFVGFLGVTAWAYARHNRARFDEAARLPLDDEPAKRCGTPACCCPPETKS
jgi:cytochrome c oxidase cbb3-type subunit 4